MNLDQIIIKPQITEKSMRRLADNQYTFQVHRDATKKDIRRAVEELFDVEVYQVKVINRRGRKKRRGPSRQERTSPARRFAVVTINPQDKIDLFEQEGV